MTIFLTSFNSLKPSVIKKLFHIGFISFLIAVIIILASFPYAIYESNEIAKSISELGSSIVLDINKLESINVELSSMNRIKMNNMSKIAKSIVDGNGVKRVLSQLECIIHD